METISLKVQLTVEKVDQILIARLTFTNDTSKRLQLDKYTICLDGKFRNNVFEITGPRGKEVSYFGIMLKRVISKDDYMMFEPGGVIKVSIKLNDAYRLELGKKYSIRYYAFNPGLSEESPLMEMVSNTVTILYK